MAIMGLIALSGLLLLGAAHQETTEEHIQRLLPAMTACEKEMRIFHPLGPSPPDDPGDAKAWEAWMQAMDALPPWIPTDQWARLFNACVDRELRPKP